MGLEKKEELEIKLPTLFGTTLSGDWDEDWPFPVLWPLLGLPELLT